MSSIRAFVLFLCLTSLAVPAGAQTGPFVPADEFSLTNGGFAGVFTVSGVDSLQIDRNGNDLFDAPDSRHPMPTGLLDDIDAQSFHLSPSRDHVIVLGTSAVSPCMGQSVVYAYEIPSAYGAPLIPLGGKLCLPLGLADIGFYDRPDFSSQRILAIREGAHPTSFLAQIHWFDLTTGARSATDFAFDTVVASVTFAPTGIAALVQYATSDGDNVSDYRLVELCADGLGQSYNPAGLPAGGLPGNPATGNVASIGGDLVGQIVHEGSVVASAVLDDCGTTPPTTGACCFADGTCANGTTQLDCESQGGTFQTVGSTCTSAACPQPPVVDLTLTASAPGSIPSPGQITYQLDYENVGTADANAVQIYANPPAGTTFVSASAGSGYVGGSVNRVSWFVGAVPAGASGSVYFTVDVDCGQSVVDFTSYWLFSIDQPGGTVLGAPNVTTTVGQPSSDPLSVDLISFPDGPLPLLRDGTVTHTIFLVNPDPTPRDGVEIGFWIGSIWRFDSVVDDGGGTVVATSNRFDWTGTVPASGSLQIVFKTRVPSCTGVATTLQDALNQGADIPVTNGCGAVLGTLFPAFLEIAPQPIGVSLTAIDGNAAGLQADQVPTYLVRAGEATTLEIAIANTYPVTVDSVDVSLVLPSTLPPSNDPPWVGTPPAGATWDAATATVGWRGPLASGTSVVLSFSVDVPAGGACSFVLDTAVRSGTCTSSQNRRTRIESVPATPNQPYLVGVTRNQGLVRYAPGVDAALIPLLCVGNEFHYSVAEGRDGSLWAVGPPYYRFHPGRLELEFFDSTDFAGAQLTQVRAMEFSEDGQTYYLGGTVSVSGQFFARVVAWNPATDQWTELFAEDTSVSPGTFRQVDDLELADDGTLVVTTSGGLLRVDPSNPGAAPQVMTDPSVLGGYTSTSFDASGALMTTWLAHVAGQARPLLSIDATTGVFTTEIADLGAIGLTTSRILGVAAEGDDRLWFTPEVGAVQVLDRMALPPTVSTIPRAVFASVVDVIWVGGGVGTAVDPGTLGDGTVRPRAVALRPVTPNPFNPRTQIAFALPDDGPVHIEIFDVRGRSVRTLVDEIVEAGEHVRVWDGADDAGRAVSSGVYLVRLTTKGERHTRRGVLVR